MALAHNPWEALLWTLRDLEENNLKIVKFHLRDSTLLQGQPPLARLRVGLASQLILMYGAQEAKKAVLKVLTVTNQLQLLRTACSFKEPVD